MRRIVVEGEHAGKESEAEAVRLSAHYHGKRARVKLPDSERASKMVDGHISHIVSVLTKNDGWTFLAWVTDFLDHVSVCVPIAEVKLLDDGDNGECIPSYTLSSLLLASQPIEDPAAPN